MEIQESCDLRQMQCKPCEGGVEPCTLDESTHQLLKLPGWVLTHDAQRIRKEWVVQNFMAAIDFFNQVAQVAEQDGHHPDLHISGYRNVTIEIWTHAIGGLSENDFILAAKIDAIPIQLK